MTTDWESKVLATYPQAKIVKELTYGKCQLFTCKDPVSGMNLGPTAFTEDNAWKYAAERLK